MKRLLLPACAALFLVACQKPVVPAAKEDVPKSLFNGSDLTGWSHVLVGEGVNKEDVWSVQDGVLVCQGKPLGYLLSEDSYQDFELSFEWRWAPGKEPGNSGVLLRIQGEPFGFMPKCVEAQLKSGSAGDVWGFFGASVDGDAERRVEIKDHEALKDFHGYKAMKTAEKEPGEWNRYEIRCEGGAMELKINGELVNKVSGLDVVSGPIGFQSEGAEIHFRDIVVKGL